MGHASFGLTFVQSNRRFVSTELRQGYSLATILFTLDPPHVFPTFCPHNLLFDHLLYVHVPSYRERILGAMYTVACRSLLAIGWPKAEWVSRWPMSGQSSATMSPRPFFNLDIPFTSLSL